MEITPQEIYCAINSLESRKEWIMDDGSSADEELPFIESLLEKLNRLKFNLEVKDD